MSASARRPAPALLAIAVLAFALVSPAAPCATPAATTTSTPLAVFAQNSVGREFYGAYLLGSKAGWISDESRMAQVQGTALFENRSEMSIEMQMQGQRLSKSMLTTTRYSLDGDGLIHSITQTDREDGTETQYSAVRDGRNLRITTREKDGKATERVVPMPRANLKSLRDVEAWLTKSPRRGEKMTVHEADLSSEEVEMETVMEFVEPTSLVWGGLPVKASRVKMHIGGAVFDALAGPDGKLLQGKIGGVLEFRAEEEELAKSRSNTPIDMLAASSIAVAQPLGDRARLNGLVLEVTGLGDFQLPNSARQRVRAASKGRATVELLREAQQPSPTPLSQQERERFLRATPSVQSDDPEIRKLAREITGTEKDPAKITMLLLDWINKNLRQQYGANAATATAVLRQKAGDCTEHSVLFTALARAAGLPARQLGGIVYVEAPAPTFGWHAWAEIHDGKGWISVDPTFRQLRVDPTHVQFSFFGDDQEQNQLNWIQVLGSVKIEVRKVERR
jgi:hypothetical protein